MSFVPIVDRSSNPNFDEIKPMLKKFGIKTENWQTLVIDNFKSLKNLTELLTKVNHYTCLH